MRIRDYRALPLVGLAPRVAALALAGALAGALGCGGTEIYDAEGVVEEVQPDTGAHGQVVVAHEDIPGLMPAMTMNFDVADPALLAKLSPGQRIRFELAYDRRSYRIVSAEVLEGGGVGAEGRRARLANLARNASPAPDFSLIDRDGATVSSADLRGKVLLVDFIYTRCPGPCPTLTGVHLEAWKALPDDLRDRVRFVSISIDPEHDTPEALDAYAKARGADRPGWSFLTGETERVEEVLRGFGIGKVLEPDGEIDHIVATFLVDPEGRIVKRYVGLEHEASALALDLTALASALGAG